VLKDDDRVELRIALSAFVFRRAEGNLSKNSLVSVVISRLFELDTVRYLNQQKHFVSGLFNPLYLEANIDVLSQCIVNLGT
jgi:hypothetical protein